MSAEDRRELVLEAGTRAFAHGGYHGTSTDAVAKEAGVSQPYVVRIFGTKLELFLEVFERLGGPDQGGVRGGPRRAARSTPRARTTRPGWAWPTPSCCATTTSCR